MLEVRKQLKPNKYKYYTTNKITLESAMAEEQRLRNGKLKQTL
jgi:hypothetical protein